MIAIEITQELKDLNKDLLGRYNVGTITELNSVPKSFYSPTYFNGQRTDGYHTLDNSIHQADGFYELVEPVFDSSIEKLGKIIFNGTTFTYKVSLLAEDEIERNTEVDESLDSASTTYKNHKENGVKLFDRVYSLIQRNLNSGDLTPNQAKTIAQYFYPILEPLYKGQWHLVKLSLDAETPPVNAKFLFVFNKIQGWVDNYILNNY